MGAQEPQVPHPADRLLRRLARAGVVELLGRQVCGEPGEELINLAVGKPDAFERVLGPESIEQLREDPVVPLRQLRSPVQSDAQRGRSQLVQVKLDHVAFGPAELEHRCKPSVPGDDSVRSPLHHKWLSLPEPGQAPGDSV
jgi:hypothetical protein